MIQAKFSVNESQFRFLNHFKEYGFKDKSSMLRTAIEFYRKQLEKEQLKKSADLYSELYTEDKEIHQLTESAIDGWPE